MTSLRVRLTALVVGVVAVVLVALAVALYIAARDAAWQQHDDALVARARAIAASAEYDDDDGDGYEIAIPPATYVEVWRPDGSVLTRTTTLDRDLDRTLADTTAPRFAAVELPDGQRGRAVGFRFTPRTETRDRVAPAALSLVLADGIGDVDRAVASVRTWFAVFAAIALVAIAALTAWSLGRGLRPLARLASELEQIDDRHLAIRLATSDQPLELQAPVRKLEQLLARLDASLSRERQFSADVSHELRTPLAGLRTTLEVTALAERSPTAYRTAIAEALVIVQQMSALVENLLMLARVEAGHDAVATPGDVPLRALVEECWAAHAALAAERGIAFRNQVPPDRIARGDREKLRIVLGNLLANAAEYTDAGGWIEVTSDGLLEVTDSGPAIPKQHLELIFDRLWRGDAARAGTGVHCGIGLSLSRALCERMHMTLTAASSADGRVRFTVASRSRGIERA